ncbi:MAG: hypothetical protein MZV49_09040 [Rhodopseudomonas palustris]|nr:hypothetical protein [Rhodopseudomonas palustris]
MALIFRTITAIQTFDIPYAMTGGGPGDSDRDAGDATSTRRRIDYLDFGYGSRAGGAACSCCRWRRPSVYLRVHAARPSTLGASNQDRAMPFGLSKRATVWLAGRSSSHQRLLPGGVDPAHLAQDRDRARQQARSPSWPEQPTLAELRARPSPTSRCSRFLWQQRRRGRRCRRVLSRAGVGAGRLRASRGCASRAAT